MVESKLLVTNDEKEKKTEPDRIKVLTVIVIT